MNYLESYIIPFSNLTDGIHNYDFIVDNKFFEQFEKSEINEGELKAFVKLEKQETFLVIEIAIEGTVHVECDRCLEYFDMPFTNNDKIILKFGEEISESRYVGEETQIFSRNETEIDISQFIYEIINIGLPLKKVHSNNKEGDFGCNNELLSELEKHIINKSNNIKTDPRWDKLKGIINNK